MPDKEGSEDKKKSVKKEELDLTKIAEAFGGYVAEANGKKNRKKNGKTDSIDDFIAAEDPFNVAKKQAEKDIKKTPIDPRFSGKEDEFASDTETSKPQEKNPLRKKEGNIKPGSVKFTKKPGEAPVRSYIDKSVIDPKFARQRKKTRDEVAKAEDEKKAARAFKKDIGGEKIISATMQDKLDKTAAKPERSRKRRSDAKSFDQLKSEIDISDAAKRAKKIGEYSPDYEKYETKRLSDQLKSKEEKQKREKDYKKRLAKAQAKGGETALPQAPTKTPQGQPQKGQSDQDKAAQEFNRQQNQLRKLQRDRMADSGATPFPQEPLPEVDPSRRPKSELTFSQFQKDRQKRLDQNKKDMEAADAYRKTPEYALQTQQKDPKTGELLSKDELKRRFQMTRQGNKQQIDKETPKDQGKIDLNRDSLKSGVGGFERGRQGTLTRNKKSPNVETMPQQVARKAGEMADKTQTAQMSYMGALGGLLTKSVSSSAAGAEAGMRYARGDKGGAALSALQGLGGGVGFAAGVANAIRSVRMARGVPDQQIFGRKPKDFNKKFFDTDKKNRQLAKVVPPEQLGMAAAAGGVVLPQLKGVVDRLTSSGLPTAKGGKAGLRRAKGGGGV